MVDLEALRASPARARVLLAAAEAALGGQEPMEEIPARQKAGLPRPGLDATALLAERAEALAQLAAAEATLAGLEPSAVSSRAALDADLLRRVAGEVLAAEAEAEAARVAVATAAARCQAEAVGSPDETLSKPEAVRRELSVARRRMAGAVISATGMAIVVAAAAWPALWYAAPVLLLALFAADLRAASGAAREARRAGELSYETEHDEDKVQAAVEALLLAEATVRSTEEAAARAMARWGALVPEGPPVQVEEIVARRLSRRQQTAPPVAIPPEDEEARAVALRLADEARVDLERVEGTLRDLSGWLGLGPLEPTDIPVAVRHVLDEAEHARLSLAWHEARRAVEATGAVSRRR